MWNLKRIDLNCADATIKQKIENNLNFFIVGFVITGINADNTELFALVGNSALIENQNILVENERNILPHGNEVVLNTTETRSYSYSLTHNLQFLKYARNSNLRNKEMQISINDICIRPDYTMDSCYILIAELIN